MIVQMIARKKNDLFAYLEYGVLLAVTLTAFFAAWISEFGTWLFAGTAFLIFLYTYFSITKKKGRKRDDV
jgi:Ca2+/Na+ antiporter